MTQRSHLPNYLLYQAGAQFLERRGFCKNLFNHWATGRGDNRYFTFPTRGEDLLAMGTIADGVFGDYHYRHPVYSTYRAAVTAGFPGLEGGLGRTHAENSLRPLVTAILSGQVSDKALASLRALRGTEGDRLLGLWLRCGLLAAETSPTDFSLTSCGSWFAGNMLLQLESALARHFPV